MSQRLIAGLVVIIFIVGEAFLIFSIIMGLSERSPDDCRRLYVVTNQRLVATDLKGNILDEMAREDIDLIVDLGNENELLVSRKGDEDSTHGFFIHLLDDWDAAVSAINTLKRERSQR